MLLGYHRAAQKRARRNGSRAEFLVDGGLVVRADITIIAIDVQTCQIRSGQGMTANSHPTNGKFHRKFRLPPLSVTMPMLSIATRTLA
jgi:hypothetical protein